MNIKKILLPVFIAMTLSVPFAARADDGNQNGNHYVDLRLSLGFGPFIYPQIVDEGYYVKGTPYNLIWSGWQLGFVCSIEILVPSVKGLGIGIAGGSFTGLNPSGSDTGNTVTVNANKNAPGGFGGGSVSFLLSDQLRMNIIAGYGGTGLSDYYGGYGPVASVSINYLFPHDNIIGGIGFRFLMMSLSSPGTSDVRAEKGIYMAGIVEASVDWLP
jgi:hypothetical protein